MINTSFGVGRNSENPQDCVEEAVKDFRNPKIIFFFSGEKHFCEYARLINETFPTTICMGCTAYRTTDAAGSEKAVLKAVAIEDGVVCSAGVIEKADNLALEYSDRVRQSLKEVGETKNTICIEFTMPFKRAEEYALMALNSVLLRNEIPVIVPSGMAMPCSPRAAMRCCAASAHCALKRFICRGSACTMYTLLPFSRMCRSSV